MTDVSTKPPISKDSAPAQVSEHARPTPAVELSVIVPTYQEAENMPELLRRLDRVLVAQGIKAEILVMDDASSDGTTAVARETAISVPVRAIDRRPPRGLSPSVIDGIGLARGRFIVVMDADLQHPPEDLPRLLAEVRRGAGFVIGSRYVSGGSSDSFGMFRSLNSKVATWMAAPLIGGAVRDPMAGFFCFPRDLVTGHALSAIGYKIGLEIICRCRPSSIVEVPIQFAERNAGESKLDVSQQLTYLRHLGRLYGWRFPAARQFVLFCIVGLTGLILDLTLMYYFLRGGVTFPVARAGAVLGALLSNFLLNRRVTFPDADDRSAPTQFMRFVMVCGVGLIINWTVSNGLYAALPAWRSAYYVFCVAGVLTATMSNFLLSKRFAFGSNKVRHDRYGL